MTEVFSSTALHRGHEYYVKGYVLSARLSDGLLKARVRGEVTHICDVHVDLRAWPSGLLQCTCRTTRYCEHIAASLYALQSGEPQTMLSQTAMQRSSTPSVVPLQIMDANDVMWYSELADEGHDFFGYELGILIGDKRINLLPLVLNVLERFDSVSLERISEDDTVLLPIGQGKRLRVNLDRLRPLLRFMFALRMSKKNAVDRLTLQKRELLLLQEIEQACAATSARWQGTEKLRVQLEQLTRLESLPVIPIPSTLLTVLRDYQQVGLYWLQSLRAHQWGGILADDMGLGKTVQTLAHFAVEKAAGRMRTSLIVAPTSLMGNWLEEARRFTPHLRVIVFHGMDRHPIVFDEYDLIISTYGLIQRDKSRFINYSFYYLVLDEAQWIKNSRAKTTQVIQQLSAQHRLCLTGTPLENHLGELWSLFHFLIPGLLGQAKQFRQHFKTPIEKQGDVEQRHRLYQRVRPFILRRTKDHVAKELPPKTEITLTVELQGIQRDLYESIRVMMEQKVREVIHLKGLQNSRITLLDALLKLRQVCCDPRLLSLPEANMAHGVSAKLEALMSLLDNLMEEGRSVLIFSQFTSMLALIEQALKERHYAYLLLTGATQNRQDVVRRFQEGAAPCFLISLKAGGTGLNLTRADTVIHYDLWWNPAVQEQATDRSHRIGQEKPVFVYHLLTQGTVEEAIWKIQHRKRALFDDLLAGHETGLAQLTDADIAEFFVPL